MADAATTPLEKILLLLKHVCLQWLLEILKKGQELPRSSQSLLPLFKQKAPFRPHEEFPSRNFRTVTDIA